TDHHDGVMRRSLVALVVTLAATACTATPSAPSSSPARPSVPPSSAAPAGVPGIRIQAVIDLLGQEALGLTADRTAVWGVAYQAGTVSRVDPATNAVTRTVQVPGAASALATRDAIW